MNQTFSKVIEMLGKDNGILQKDKIMKRRRNKKKKKPTRNLSNSPVRRRRELGKQFHFYSISNFK